MPQRRQLWSAAQENALLQRVGDQGGRLDAEHPAAGRRLGDRGRDEVTVVDDPEACRRATDEPYRRHDAGQPGLERREARLLFELELEPGVGERDVAEAALTV